MLAVARVTSIISEERVEFVFAIMKIKDLQVWGSSRVVSLDKALCSLRSWRYCVGAGFKFWRRSRVPKKGRRDEAVEIPPARKPRYFE